jgi:hypothetical protein
MSEKAALIKRFVEIAFERFDWAMKDLSEKEIDWRPLKETNSIRWILTHLSQQWNVGIHKILKGDPEYKPKDWAEDYIDNRSYSLSKIMSDIEKGRADFINCLEELTLAELDAKIPLWGEKRRRQYGLLLYASEIFHHVGQIAYIRGAIKRREQTDDDFLT